MMQQFFNIEQEFKQVAETTATHSSADSSPAFYSSLGTHAVLSTQKKQPNIADEDTEIGDAECISDDEFDDSLSPNIDFESMGRIDAKEATSKSQLRRQRRQKREKMFAVMKRGRFWEINEMRKEMHD
uniref:Uncharacterized protein n=1 Tax=Globodera rostochiensis TaxID=31243 RepID=A0A914HD64_GLORO